MHIAVAGATGNIGARTAAALKRDGHDVVRISRSLGVDLMTGDGLEPALAGVEAVVDAISAPPTDREQTTEYFGATTRNLLAAEQRCGVRHHVLLSIVGIHAIEGNAHYDGKREQERLIAEILAEVAVGGPQGHCVDVAGPEPQDLVDMARRTHEVRGHEVKLAPTWSGIFGESMAGNVLLPGENARIAPTTFDQWLAAGAGS